MLSLQPKRRVLVLLSALSAWWYGPEKAIEQMQVRLQDLLKRSREKSAAEDLIVSHSDL